MLSDVKVAKQGIELILGKYIIIVLQHIYCEAFAETARTNKEEKLVRLFYHGYKPGFVYIITVVAADYCKVHHAVWDTFPVRCYIFFHNLYLILGTFFEHKQRYGLFVTSPNKHSITSRYLCTLLNKHHHHYGIEAWILPSDCDTCSCYLGIDFHINQSID